jgi:hypothetical protein
MSTTPKPLTVNDGAAQVRRVIREHVAKVRIADPRSDDDRGFNRALDSVLLRMQQHLKVSQQRAHGLGRNPKKKVIKKK